VGCVGEFAVEPLVGVLVTDDPAAVGMEHHRQDVGGASGTDDPDADLAARPPGMTRSSISACRSQPGTLA
jgi:hypothetical protein